MNLLIYLILKKMKDLKKYKLKEINEIDKQDFIKLLKGTIWWYETKILLAGMKPEGNCPFPQVQNARYYIEKVGRKGQIGEYDQYKNSVKADIGLFEVSIIYDYKHPTNFAQNNNNIEQTFKLTI